MATIIGRHIYINGIKRTTTPVALSSTFNVSQWHNPQETISVQSNLVYDDGSESPLTNSQEITLANDVVIEPFEMVDVANFTATNASQPLSIEGGNGPIHPRVIDMKTQWNGYRYWMCFTPYAGNNPDIENSSVVVSNEPPSETQTWVIPTGGSNPIFPQPATGYNSDAELIYDETNDLLWLINRRVEGGTDYIEARSTSDGINWNTKIILFSEPQNSVSPTIIKDGDLFRIYLIRSGGAYNPPRIETATANAIDGTWSAFEICKVYYDNGDFWWHISVNKIEDRYHAFAYRKTGGSVYFSESLTPEDFYFRETPLLEPSTSGWDNGNLYQTSAIILDNGNYGIYYSAYKLNDSNSKGIGFTEVDFPVLNTDNSILVTSGLLGFFPFNENTGEPIDSYGSLTATATPSLRGVAGLKGTAFELNNGYLKITGTNIKSLSMFVKIPEWNGGYQYIFDARTALTAYYANSGATWTSSGVSKILWNNMTLTQIGKVPHDRWVHLYIEFTNQATGEITLFSRYTNGDYLDATVDMLGVYNKNLSTAEIYQNMNYLRGIEI